MTSFKLLLKQEVTLSLALSSPSPLSHQTLKPEERGIRLIELLLKCANHASSGNLKRADVCLSEISQLSSISGDSIQRLAAQFASALALRLLRRWPGLYKAINHDQQPNGDDGHRAKCLFVQALPYLGSSYTIIARTLLQAMIHEPVIHLVDLGCTDPKLWVPILHGVAELPNGPPNLKVTCLNTNKLVLDKLEERLKKEAQTLNMPFEFIALNICLKELTSEMLQITSGEALAFISILNIHVLLAEDDRVDVHFGGNYKSNSIKDCKPINDFLTMIRSLSPKLFLLLEQETDLNINRLGDRFVECLHYYSAIFDSIDAKLGNCKSGERSILEEMFGKEIENIVAGEGLERTERHERYERWRIRLSKAGFKAVRFFYNEEEDSKQMVEAFGEGFKIVNERTSLMICWHERPLYALSAWIC
ncbi:scarecrow-like 3 [Euphorbia peplus]|nr:scarecrow-like 3 [Euphorbia peplus]